MSHRIRHPMDTQHGGLLGSGGGTIEADETYVGRTPESKVRGGPGHKEAVFSLVERRGTVRSVHITGETFGGIKRSLKKNASPDAVLMTDNACVYRNIAKEFAEHHAVNHSAGEYVRGDAHTNTTEGYFSVSKRGLIGVYQHYRSDHLHRYSAELDFRYNNRTPLGVDDADRRAWVARYRGAATRVSKS